MEPTPGSQSGDEEVLNIDFGRYVEAVRKYAWVIAAIVALSVTAAVIYTARQTKVYQATASVQVEPRLPDVLGQGAELLAGGAATGEYYKQQLSVLKSNTLLRATVETYQLQLQLMTDKEREGLPEDTVYQRATERLADMLKVTYPNGDRILYVTVKSPNAKLAADIANDHVAAYFAYSQGLISTTKAADALQKQFENSEKELRDAEAALYKFQKDNDLLAVSIEDKQSLVSSNITSYTARLNDARAHRIELNARLTRMRKAATGDVLDSPVLALSQSTALDTLKASYFEERTKFAELEKEMGPKSPEYQMQKAKVDDLYASLQAEVQRQVGAVNEEYLTAVATETALGGEVDHFKQEALDLGPVLVGYNDLARKKKSAEDKYNILVARLSTNVMTGELNKATDASLVKPLDSALEPTDPVSPKLKVNVAIAAAISLFFGIGLAILLAWLDRSVKSLDDAQAAAGAPVLGMIPMIAEGELAADDDKARDLYVHQHPTHAVSEFCRSLRTNILFSGGDRELKTLVVSSPNQREGKTTTVIYLGTTMAQSGQRVLLVDTDMRRPRLHRSMGVSREKGLSNLIVGEEAFEDVIKSTEIPNLYVLPCGPTPPNPAELLMTKRFAHVLEELKARFDRVILDSPPLQGLTDAVVLSKQTDGALLVVRAGKTLRDEVRRAAREIRSVDGPITGVILNEFDMEDRRYGYYYRYRYNYAYGEDQKEQEASQTA
ncbi:MAG TPA: polysaccharide biosynthesis tyrosine autokinase [Kofleriaceae bacterium]|nr:polysaccharide biosynthesis tyrosine autokinase [Kofleriaceae bacterium]